MRTFYITLVSLRAPLHSGCVLQIFEEDPVNDQVEQTETMVLCAKQLRVCASGSGLPSEAREVMASFFEQACSRSVAVLQLLLSPFAETRWVGGVLFQSQVFHGVLSCVLSVHALAGVKDARTDSTRAALASLTERIAPLLAPSQLRIALENMRTEI